MPVVISDTSPLRALAHLGHLEWLQELFRQVCLPPAVAAELRHPPSSLAVVDVSAWHFLFVQSPSNGNYVPR
jgi:predicted nucleic acid-binding protein